MGYARRRHWICRISKGRRGRSVGREIESHISEELGYDRRMEDNAEIIARYAEGRLDFQSAVDALLEVITQSDEESPLAGDSLSPLFSLLGCRNIRASQCGGVPWHLDEPCQPDETNEHTIVETLLSISTMYARSQGVGRPFNVALILSFVDGMRRGDRWRECLSTVESANNLALILLQGAMSSNNPATGSNSQLAALRHTCEPSLYEVINAWMEPSEPITNDTMIDKIVRIAFGEIWYDLTFGGASWYAGSAPVNGLWAQLSIMWEIKETPPTLLPRLLGPGIDQELLELPTNVGA